MRPLLLVLTIVTSGCTSAADGGPPPADVPAAGDPTADAPTTVRPGAPGEESRVVGPDEDPDRPRQGYAPADAEFMRGMIVHHAQALVMTDLAEERTDSPDLRSAARRIGISQIDEIDWMARWLHERGEEVPDPPATYEEWRERAGPDADGAHDDHGAPDEQGAPATMPGMLSPAEMERLAGARGAEFDRLFLEHMVQHHEGALVMVETLFSAGAGQEPEIYLFASDVDADQRAEIERMRHMLDQRLQGDTR